MSLLGVFNISNELRYPTPYATSPLLPYLLLTLASQEHTPDTTNSFLDSYDYIIVGAGAAGAVVAARLSENPCANILLLEAGESPPLLNEIPAIARSFVGTDLDWNYLTVPQKHAGFGLNNNQLPIPTGKGIGGSSILNGMVYNRGHKDNYDEWAAQGATGWTYFDVVAYFQKVEWNTDPDAIDQPYHGFDGPVTVSTPKSKLPYAPFVEAALYELDYPPIDVNGHFQRGAYDYQGILRDGQRCSMAKSYLVPSQYRKNLHIVKNALVTKILIEDRRAIGVLVDYNGTQHEIFATSEVIVSAGALNTPKLLMLSGIGPKEHLEAFGIPLVADLPVGQNLQDHYAAIMSYYSNEMTPQRNEIAEFGTMMNYINYRSGLMATVEGNQYLAFLTNNRSAPQEAVPDYELYISDATDDRFGSALNVKPEVYEQVYGPYHNLSQMWCISQVLQPKSRGYVELQSSDPYASPLINPNYLADARDLMDIVEGMKECNRLFHTEPLRILGFKPLDTLYPGCEEYADDENAYLECQAMTVVISLSEPVGTAKMGNVNDPTAVVDPELRVMGISGLRVADASIMPTITTANIIAPEIMIGEKAADFIKQTFPC